MRATDFCVGELSTLDVAALVRIARQSSRVLEFGVGGSTSVWAQFCAPGSRITCVERNPEWIARTKQMCERLHAHVAPTFVPWDDWAPAKGAWYDLIFIDDLHMSSRIPIAEDTWDLLMPEGLMVWHDSHSPQFGKEIFEFLADRHLEVGEVRRESALTIVRKAVETRIGNTDAFELRAAWESGHAPLPEKWPNR